MTDPSSILNSTTGTSFEISNDISNFTDWMNTLDDKPQDGDTLILTEDISFSNDSDEPFIITVAVNIMLNGKTLTLDKDGVQFQIESGDHSGYVYIDSGTTQLRLETEAGKYNGTNGIIDLNDGPGFISVDTFKYETENEIIMKAVLVKIVSNIEGIGTVEDTPVTEDNDD
jgi:hypothetical protein